MLYILQIYKKLCDLFHKKNDEKYSENSIENELILSVNIDSEFKRNINIYIPDNMTTENIPLFAEVFADTIIEISQGTISQQIIQNLKNSIDKYDPNEKLFLDNILFSVVYKSQLKSQKYEPMVRPSQVFNK